jgi:hypothetical protein
MKVYHYGVLAARCCFILATEQNPRELAEKKGGP